MAVNPISDRRAPITMVNDGDRFILGEADRDRVGAFSLHFVPDSEWVGTLTVKGRSAAPGASDDAVEFSAIPYHRATVNGQPSDYAIVSDVIDGPGIVVVPAAGLVVAIDLTVAAGSGVLYVLPLVGPAVP